MSYGCYECHGTVAQGNYFVGPPLAPKPIPFAVLVTYIRRPSGQMPSYSTSILPDRDAADIYAYLLSILPAKPVGAIPLLSHFSVTPK
jgi:mono/diheme cytochrome c family protein